MEITNLNHCYGCGKDNPIGLHLLNTYIGDKSHIEFEVKSDYCGYPGIMHGGVTGILFDEVMFYAIAKLNVRAVTSMMTIDYKSPALKGHLLICEAWIEKQVGRKIEVAAVINDSATGKIIAEGKGRFLEVDIDNWLKNLG